MERLIYGLACPVTDDIHYVGKSTQGMRRPMQHLSKSHSKKVNEWVKDLQWLGHKPKILVLEEVKFNIDIDLRERYWISKCIDDGYLLLNETLIIPATIRTDLDELIKTDCTPDYQSIGRFVAERRKMVGLTQEEFANKIGVALTVVRKIEQGKDNVVFSSLLMILSMFGCTLKIDKIDE